MEAAPAGASTRTPGPVQRLGEDGGLHFEAVEAVEAEPLTTVIWEHDDPRPAASAMAVAIAALR